MDVAGLNAWMAEHFTGGGSGKATAFRLETLQTYEVASDGSDFRRYLDGAPTWTPERKEPWLATLRAEVASGRRRSRVRIVTRPVSDYTRYECEWGYAPNVEAGEDVRILDLGDHAAPKTSGHTTSDFWLVTDVNGHEHLASMMYHRDDGRFLGAYEVTLPLMLDDYRHTREALWSAAEPFSRWWARHGELHRKVSSPA